MLQFLSLRASEDVGAIGRDRCHPIADVNSEPRPVDEQVDRWIGGEPPEPDLAELLKSPGQGRVIRNREIQL